jgi:uncharacterized protein (DUF58 family)
VDNPPSKTDLLDPFALSRIEDFNLLGRMVAEGVYGGLHKSIHHGRGTEFFQYRNYSPGEDLKFVDWKVFARSNNLYSKTFEEETNTTCYLVLDTSASMSYKGSRSPCHKLRYASMAAAALGYLANRQGDAVGLFAYGEEINEWIEPRTGQDHLQAVYQALNRLKPEGQSRHKKGWSTLLNRLPGRGIVLFFSDMLEAESELPELLKFGQSVRYDSLALQVLDPDELDLPYSEALEFSAMEERKFIPTYPEAIRQNYQQRMDEFCKNLHESLAGVGSQHMQISTNQSLGEALGFFLHHRERRG